MKFEGILIKPAGKKNPDWRVEVPALKVATQGTSRSDALRKIKEAIETAVDLKSFRIDVHATGTNSFVVRSDDTKALIAFLLRQQRQSRGLTLEAVSARLGINSPNAYARYEQGKTMPSYEKLEELLIAIDPDNEPILKIA